MTGKNFVSNSSISIVMPLFNKERYVNRSVESVLAQSFQNFEVIVVNDGSTDNSSEIVRKIHDSRIRLIEQKNAGVSAARNRGIHEAKSELIAFLDADDEWLPDFLETILGLAYLYPDAGAYATDYLLLKGDKKRYRKTVVKTRQEKYGCYFDLLSSGIHIWTSSIAVRRVVFDKAGTFRVGYRLGEDLDMWFRIGLYYKYACSTRICALYHYYQLDNACHTAVPNRVSPLCISSLRLKNDAHINPEIKSKAIKYLSHELEKDITFVFLKGFRDIATLRLNLYRRQFGINFLYVKLFLMNMVPPFLLRLANIIKLRLTQYLLVLNFFMHHNFHLSGPK
jgi:glycosyltransferase involved in cell wall biosynthesis